MEVTFLWLSRVILVIQVTEPRRQRRTRQLAYPMTWQEMRPKVTDAAPSHTVCAIPLLAFCGLPGYGLVSISVRCGYRPQLL